MTIVFWSNYNIPVELVMPKLLKSECTDQINKINDVTVTP
jgi:hypothetical protein